jgi:hypothetical protein
MLYFGAPFAYLLSKLASLPDLAAAPIVPTHPPTAKKQMFKITKQQHQQHQVTR